MMWPWGHLAIGYLLYTLSTRYRLDRPPSGMATLLVVLGTQFPDLVDKPLAWTLSILPGGRTLAHTLLVALPVSLAVYLYFRQYWYAEWGFAFTLGYLSHIFADAFWPLFAGEFVYVRFLLWPVYPMPTYEGSPSIIAYFLAMEATPQLAVEVLLFVVATLVWVYDGKPAVATVQTMWRWLSSSAP